MIAERLLRNEHANDNVLKQIEQLKNIFSQDIQLLAKASKKQEEYLTVSYEKFTAQISQHSAAIKQLTDFKDSDYLNDPIKQWKL